MNDYITTDEAASILSVSRRRVQKLIADGTLPTTRVGHAHLVRKADALEAAKSRNTRPGRPPKKSQESP